MNKYQNFTFSYFKYYIPINFESIYHNENDSNFMKIEKLIN